MSLPAGWPSLHEVESANWDHLKAAGDQWPKLADQWESAFTEVRDQSMRPGGTDWEGSSADAVQARTDGDIAKVRGPAEQLREAAAVAGRGFGQQTSAQRALLEAVDDAKRDGFNVGPDYTVTDTKTSYDSASERDDRAKAAQEHSDFIRYRVTNLVGGEGDIGDGITKATAGLDGLSFPDDAADGGAGAPPGGKPSALQDPRNPAAARTDGAAGNAPGAAASRLNPADVESFKAMARQSMASDGVPPDQIEARLDAIVTDTQQWMDNGMPNYVPPQPQRPPPPGFGEGFGDRWRATEQGIKNLIGQGGPGAPGVLESWEQMVKGTAEMAQNPLGAMTGEIANAVGSPSPGYYLGEKASDAAVTLPGLLFGGEGAAVAGEVGDAAAVYDGVRPLPHSPVGLDNPANYHSWAPSAGQDLYSAWAHGEPTAGLSQQLADMSTHYIGDNPDRLVLGKWEGQDGGYIGEARANGGIYFDTGDPSWDAMTYGLSTPEEQSLVWPVNEQAIRTQMENQVGRIDYLLDREKYSSLEDMVLANGGSYSALEVEFLSNNSAAYGYERVGDSWIYMGDG